MNFYDSQRVYSNEANFYAHMIVQVYKFYFSINLLAFDKECLSLSIYSVVDSE